jgi:DNA primase
MQIFPDKDYYRCFSCNSYGDQIDLAAEALNIPLPDAISLLAKELGIDTAISQEERDRIELEQARRRQERQREIDQQNTIKAEYKRLIETEKLMYFFISTIKEESDLDRYEVTKSLQNKELIGHWIDVLLNGKLEEQLAVLEASKNFNPWEEVDHEKATSEETGEAET